jgi:hypothetical protein
MIGERRRQDLQDKKYHAYPATCDPAYPVSLFAKYFVQYRVL